MFKKLLIANRGEIACRVITTARRMGVRTVAVYSDADAGSRHVAMADEAVRLGPAAARDSYLRGDLIIEAARSLAVDAVHPGYGFLSENESFAQSLTDAGITFVGPPPFAIHAMGSKSEAKSLMERCAQGAQGASRNDRSGACSPGTRPGWLPCDTRVAAGAWGHPDATTGR